MNTTNWLKAYMMLVYKRIPPTSFAIAPKLNFRWTSFPFSSTVWRAPTRSGWPSILDGSGVGIAVVNAVRARDARRIGRRENFMFEYVDSVRWERRREVWFAWQTSWEVGVLLCDWSQFYTAPAALCRHSIRLTCPGKRSAWYVTSHILCTLYL